MKRQALFILFSCHTLYAHMEGMTEINSDGVMEDAVEVFENLMLAG